MTIAETSGGIWASFAGILAPVWQAAGVIWGYIWGLLLMIPNEILIIFGVGMFLFALYEFYEHSGTSWMTSFLVTIIIFVIIVSGVGYASGIDVWGKIFGIVGLS